MSRHRVDETWIARYVDGALGAPERVQFENRLAADADLRRAVAELRAQSRLLREADPIALRAPQGFAAGVLARVAALPSRAALVADATALESVVAYGRRLLVAAALLAGLALLFGLKVIGSADSGLLQASDASRQIRELDQRVQELRARELAVPRGK